MKKAIEGNISCACPHCKNEIDEWEKTQIEDGKLYYYFTCPSCGATGYEVYKLLFDKVVAYIDAK